MGYSGKRLLGIVLRRLCCKCGMDQYQDWRIRHRLLRLEFHYMVNHFLFMA